MTKNATKKIDDSGKFFLIRVMKYIKNWHFHFFKDTENKIFKKEIDEEDSSDSDEKKLFIKSEKKLTKTRSKWSHKEAVYLVIGVQLFGKGSWAKILERFKKKFGSNRTSVHLKDKYRTLEKNTSDLRLYEKEAANLIKEINQESDDD